MRCEKCGSTSNLTLETRRVSFQSPDDGLKRKRLCRSCGHEWITTERVDRFDRRLKQWDGHPADRAQATARPRARRARQKKPAAFWPVTMEQAADDLLGIPADVGSTFLEWWNNSRRSKHASGAAWTQAAFRGSANRVKALPHWQQAILVQAGVEHGWQALYPSYIKERLMQQQRGAGWRPQSAGLAGALSVIQGAGNGTT
jgi:hypothetical protein